MKGAAQKIPLFFDVREAGTSLEEVAVDVIESEGHNLTSYWYHSPLEVDVYIWFDEKKNVIKQQVSICGQICEWNIIDGVRTGCVFDTGDEEDNKGSIVQYDNAIHKTALFQAMSLLSHFAILPEYIKIQLLSNFENNPTADHLDPNELLARYGDKAKDFKGSLAKFFKKLFK